jgi:hypothetical protein
MSERVPHCPFLNRADSRCANHFSLDRLGSAFDHCFGEYKACATYAEMLDERRHRPDSDNIAADSVPHGNFPQPAVYSTVSRSTRLEPVHVNVSFVQVRVRREHATIA